MKIPKELIYITVFLACVLIVSVIIRQPEFEDKDCSDFLSQEEAMEVFKQNKNDIHGLDRNKNLLPCENLPTK